MKALSESNETEERPAADIIFSKESKLSVQRFELPFPIPLAFRAAPVPTGEDEAQASPVRLVTSLFANLGPVCFSLTGFAWLQADNMK